MGCLFDFRNHPPTTEESREPEGAVVSHEPPANRHVAVETEVDLVVATPVTVLVPDLVGLDEAVVDALLRNTELYARHSRARGISAAALIVAEAGNTSCS